MAVQNVLHNLAATTGHRSPVTGCRRAPNIAAVAALIRIAVPTRGTFLPPTLLGHFKLCFVLVAYPSQAGHISYTPVCLLGENDHDPSGTQHAGVACAHYMIAT